MSTADTDNADEKTVGTKNIALVVAVSEYDSQTSLPGGLADARVVKEILERSRRFSRIVEHTGTVSSAELKDTLAQLAGDYKAEEVGEFLVYLSGHGGAIDGDFRFLPSDYSSKRPESTSLSNTELDEYARVIAPELFVKMVDACHAGVPYIKAPSFQEHVEKARGIEKCYFLYSSQRDQSSYQGRLSHFTEALASAIIKHQTPRLRYRDLIASVADHFSVSGRQRPYFVSQADSIELFTNINDTFREAIKNLLQDIHKEDTDNTPPASIQTLLEAVQKNADECCSKEDAITKIRDYYSLISGSTLPGETSHIYDLECTTLDFSAEKLTYESRIARWFSVDEREKRYFISLQYGGDEPPQHRRLASQRRPTSITPNSFEFEDCIELILHPKFPELPEWKMVFLAVPSRKSIAIVLVLSKWIEQSWDEFRHEQSSLRGIEIPLLEFAAEEEAPKHLQMLFRAVERRVREQFQVDIEDEEDEEDEEGVE